MATTDSHARNTGDDNGDRDNFDDYSVLSSALTVLASNRQDLTPEEEQALQQQLQALQQQLQALQQLRGLDPDTRSQILGLQRTLQAGPQQLAPTQEVEVDGGSSGVSDISTPDNHHAGGGSAVVASGGGPCDVGVATMVLSGGGVGDHMPPPDTHGTDAVVRFQDHPPPSSTVAGTIGSQSDPGTLGGFSAGNDSTSLPAR